MEAFLAIYMIVARGWEDKKFVLYYSVTEYL